MADIMKMFTTVYKDKLKTKEKTKTTRTAKYQKQQKAQEVKRLQKHKHLKKEVYKKLGQMESKKAGGNPRQRKRTTNDSMDE